jgi:hypothetical protein
MREFIAAGFWRAIIISVVFILAPFGITERITKKMNRNISENMPYVIGLLPGTILLIYIWTIRHGIGWLIASVLLLLTIIGYLRTLIFDRKNYFPGEGENFEGYAEQAKVKNEITAKIDILKSSAEKASDTDKNKFQEAIAELEMLQRNVMRLGELDITRKKLEYYRDLVDTTFGEAMGTYKPKIGGIAGFILKILGKN